jgi:hypothetical protein
MFSLSIKYISMFYYWTNMIELFLKVGIIIELFLNFIAGLTRTNEPDNSNACFGINKFLNIWHG